MQLNADQTVDDILVSIKECRGSEPIVRLIERYTQEMGFELFSYYIVQPPKVQTKNYLVTNYPEAWKKQYTAEHYVSVDPVVQTTAERTTPFLWDGVVDPRWVTPVQRKFFSEAAEAGVLVGGSVPLRGPGRCMATLSVSNKQNLDGFAALWAQHRHSLHLLACYAHEHIVPFIYAENMMSCYSLSPRERECMLWTARGKSAWEIGEIMNISQFTAEDHIKRSCRKLGASNRIHAVVVAIMNNLIIP